MFSILSTIAFNNFYLDILFFFSFLSWFKRYHFCTVNPMVTIRSVIFKNKSILEKETANAIKLNVYVFISAIIVIYAMYRLGVFQTTRLVLLLKKPLRL